LTTAWVEVGPLRVMFAIVRRRSPAGPWLDARRGAPVARSPAICTQELAPLPGLPGLAGLAGEAAETGDAGLDGESGAGATGGGAGAGAGEAAESGEAGLAGLAGLVGEAEPGDAGLAGLVGEAAESGDAGLAGLVGEAAESGDAGLAGLLGEAAEPGDAGLLPADVALARAGDGVEICPTLAADASAVEVTGMVTGADSRGTLACSFSTTLSGVTGPSSGAARTNPPMATPAIAPAAAASFQSSGLSEFIGDVLSWVGPGGLITRLADLGVVTMRCV